MEGHVGDRAGSALGGASLIFPQGRTGNSLEAEGRTTYGSYYLVSERHPHLSRDSKCPLPHSSV